MVESSKILVTGGAGFIGSHLVDYLLENGHEVSILDNLTTGKLENIERALEMGADFIEGSILDYNLMENLCMHKDVIFHLAAQSSVSVSVQKPLYDAKVNVQGTINLIQASLTGNIRHFINFSSGGAVYGEISSNVLPVPEEISPSPMSPYALSKWTAENYIRILLEQTSCNYTIIRPANVYGPRQDPNGEAGVISIFIGALLQDKPLKIFGTGTDTRDYVFVSDVVTASTLALKDELNSTLNVGTGLETSVNELVHLISQISGKHPAILNEAPRKGDIARISLDSTRIFDLFDWKPETSLRDGIEKTWKWFQLKA